MLSRKQFISALLSGVIIFIVLFGVCYAYFYKLGIEEPIVKDDAVEVIAQDGELPIPIEEEVVVRISPTTKVKIELMSDGELQETKELEVNSVMGMSEADLEKHLSAYEVVVFTEEQVILQKNVEKAPLPPSYVLGEREGMVGILETTGTQEFISLNMNILEFSRVAAEMIANEDIPISALERQKLQRNPYYIEAILQNHH